MIIVVLRSVAGENKESLMFSQIGISFPGLADGPLKIMITITILIIIMLSYLI